VTDKSWVDSLQQAFDLTREMLSAARRDEWQRVVELDARRQPLLQAAFREPIPPSTAGATASLARRVHALNEELVYLGESGRTSVSQALAQLSRGRRARAAYGQRNRT